MNKNQQRLQIRMKKIALLIFDARKAAQKSQEECAAKIGVSLKTYADFESGALSPSLPQLEMLALYLNIPLNHFWGKDALSTLQKTELLTDHQRFAQIRNRMIGANLKIARNLLNLSINEVSVKTDIPEEQIKAYELGESAAPVPELEMLCATYDLTIEKLFDEHGPVGKWRSQMSKVERFNELPLDMQEFVCKPVNRPYLELALRLSELNADKLRSVAESLLEITY